jgi:uracil-DNA glycosylase
MLLQPLWDWLETAVFPLPSVDGERPLFNFYRDEDPHLDCPGAARLRRENLRRNLERFASPPVWLAIGEAPGWRGARFSGAPFTSESMLAGRLGFTGRPTSRSDPPYSEATATLFWRAFAECDARSAGVLAWNCLPFHPHRPGNPLSNRRPTPGEIEAHLPLLVELVRLVRPRRVLAIGRCAQSALALAGVPSVEIRHPSHGGAKIFHSQVKQALATPADAL